MGDKAARGEGEEEDFDSSKGLKKEVRLFCGRLEGFSASLPCLLTTCCLKETSFLQVLGHRGQGNIGPGFDASPTRLPFK